eukprot:gene57092-biopygen27621
MVAGNNDTGGESLDVPEDEPAIETVSNFPLLGCAIHEKGSYAPEVSRRLSSAGHMLHRLLPTVLKSKYLRPADKYKAFQSFVLSRLMVGAASRNLPRVQFRRLRKFYNRGLRHCANMTLLRMQTAHVTDADIRDKLGAPCFEELTDQTNLRWAGHVARMTPDRLPLQTMFGYVEEWGRPDSAHLFRHRVKDALFNFSIPASDWFRIAQDRADWRSHIHNKWHNDHSIHDHALRARPLHDTVSGLDVYDSASDNGTLWVRCPFTNCTARYSGSRRLQRLAVHYRKHVPRPPLRCQRCSRHFTTATALTRHTRADACSSSGSNSSTSSDSNSSSGTTSDPSSTDSSDCSSDSSSEHSAQPGADNSSTSSPHSHSSSDSSSDSTSDSSSPSRAVTRARPRARATRVQTARARRAAPTSTAAMVTGPPSCNEQNGSAHATLAKPRSSAPLSPDPRFQSHSQSNLRRTRIRARARSRSRTRGAVPALDGRFPIRSNAPVVPGCYNMRSHDVARSRRSRSRDRDCRASAVSRSPERPYRRIAAVAEASAAAARPAPIGSAQGPRPPPSARIPHDESSLLQLNRFTPIHTSITGLSMNPGVT